MVAAKNDPLADSASTDLSLDMLPGESVEQARSRQDSYNTLSLPPDADQLHNQQAAALNPTTPPASATTKTTVAKPVNAPPKDAAAKDTEAPLPVTQLSQIIPVRAPIANPYDILNR